MTDLSNSAPEAENAAPQAADTPAEGTAPEKASEPQDERAAMSDAYDKIVAKLDAEEAEAAKDPDEKPAKATPPKGPDGKFQSTKPKDETAAKATEDQQPDATKPDSAQPTIEAPAQWSAQAKAQWSTLPPNVQQEIVKRATEDRQALSRVGAVAKQAEPFLEVASQHWDYLKSKGLQHPVEAFDRLVRFQQFMDKDPRAAISQLAKDYGVKFDTIEGEPNFDDPRVSQLEVQLRESSRRIAELEGMHRSYAEKQAQAETSQSLSIIDKFASGKPDWNALERDVLVHVKALRDAGDSSPPETILEKAYEHARWSNPQTREAMLRAEAERQLKAKTEKAAKARAAQSFNVSSAPVPAGQFTSERDYLSHVYDQAMANS